MKNESETQIFFSIKNLSISYHFMMTAEPEILYFFYSQQLKT